MAAAEAAFPNGSDGKSPLAICFFLSLSLSLSLNVKKRDIDFGRTRSILRALLLFLSEKVANREWVTLVPFSEKEAG
jgi:hypothetical protein